MHSTATHFKKYIKYSRIVLLQLKSIVCYQCFVWQSLEQYFASLHFPHRNSFSREFPQWEQTLDQGCFCLSLFSKSIRSGLNRSREQYKGSNSSRKRAISPSDTNDFIPSMSWLYKASTIANSDISNSTAEHLLEEKFTVSLVRR